MIFLFFIPLFSPAQKKGDNVIVVHLKDTAGISSKLKMLLFDNRYTVESFDAQNLLFTTGEKLAGNALVKLMIQVKDSAVILYAMGSLAVEVNFAGVTVPKTFMPVSFGGSKGSPNRNAWNELNAFASQIGGLVEYLKRS